MDLPEGKVADAQELLEDALKSNMETARLYSELKTVKDALEKKNEEMRQIYVQLERSNQDNMKTRRYLEGLIQSVGEAIISFGADGRILTWNTAAEQIFGYARAEIVGRTLHQLTPPSRAGELDQAIAQVAKGQTIRDVPTERLRKDGTEFPARITYAPIRGGDDRVLAYSALIRDEGEHRRLERRLSEIENLSSLTRIMPPLFNELTNRLTPMVLQRDLLLEAAGPVQAVRMGKLLMGVDYVQNLLKPLLMICSPAVPRLEQVNLNLLVQEAAKRLEAEAAAAGVSMEFSLDPNLGQAALDPGMMREGLLCMLRAGLRSASKASTAKRLRIGTRQVAAGLQLVSQDTGAALTPEVAKHVFDLSKVADADSLGACVIAAVVKAHGGKITVRSQDGLGNAYLVELPMTEGTPVAPTPADLQGARILVVDDEQFLLECLVDAIGSWGCDVTSCSMASEAIQKLQGASYDLIVSDIRMPGLSGIQFFDWIQQNQAPMAKRILFTTGDSFDPETRAFLDQAKLPSLGKPFDLKKLRQAVADLMVAKA
jgi:two-component system NtrC family sensor kinase